MPCNGREAAPMSAAVVEAETQRKRPALPASRAGEDAALLDFHA